MAVMKKIALETIKTAGRALKVGHNRTVEYWPNEGVFVGRLHGHDVIQYNPTESKVCLDSHGYHGMVTREAMKDFLGFFDIPGNVSFAKGKFTARVWGQEISRDDTHVLTFTQ